MNEMEDAPHAKRMKIEVQCEDASVSQINESNSPLDQEPAINSELVINPVTKFENNDISTLEQKETSESVSEECKASTSHYNVTSEELQKLREFQVLDEVNDEDSKDEESDSSGADKTDELPDEEIERMLEEDLPEDFKGVRKQKEKPYVTRQKIVLQEKGINHFEVLPLDWMMVPHCSGMPVYMHRGTRVCTLSKPYFLGKGNIRRHDIPISAIPCLAYRKALEEEEKQKEIDKSIAEQIQNGTWANNTQETQPRTSGTKTSSAKGSEVENSSSALNVETAANSGNPESQSVKDKRNNSIPELDDHVHAGDATLESNSDTSLTTNPNECPYKKDQPGRKPVVLPGGMVMPPPRVETVNESWKTQHLSAEHVNEYCKNLFHFKTVNIMHFKRWADRRKYVKVRKTLQYPTLPQGTKLITIPAQNSNGQESGGKATKRDWVMNMNGCSYLSVFHEYVRRALQKQPVYEFRQLENAATPYQATVYIGGMQYGVGHGSSKRQAKSAAARASIHILIPEMKDELDQHTSHHPPKDTSGEPDSFFDHVGIEDPRIQEFCGATSEPSPHAILRTCLLRNFGAGDRHIHTEMKKLEYQKIELTMKVGKHSATVVCKNKKQAKQRASQSILQQLHPHIRSWGSLLRLYGSRSVKSCKEKKLEEQQITLLQDKAQQNEPNYAVLEKLRIEMRKLKERDAAVVPIGTLMVAEDLPTHSGSMLNNVDL